MASDAKPPLGVTCATPLLTIANNAKDISAKEGLCIFDPPNNTSLALAENKIMSITTVAGSMLGRPVENAKKIITKKIRNAVNGASPRPHDHTPSANSTANGALSIMTGANNGAITSYGSKSCSRIRCACSRFWVHPRSPTGDDMRQCLQIGDIPKLTILTKKAKSQTIGILGILDLKPTCQGHWRQLSYFQGVDMDSGWKWIWEMASHMSLLFGAYRIWGIQFLVSIGMQNDRRQERDGQFTLLPR